MSNLTPFKFSVVQFHRDPIRGEPINIGLLAVSASEAVVRFEERIAALLKLDKPMTGLIETCVEELTVAARRPEERMSCLDRLSQLYSGMVQVTETRGGLADNLESHIDSLFRALVAHPGHAKRERKGSVVKGALRR